MLTEMVLTNTVTAASTAAMMKMCVVVSHRPACLLFPPVISCSLPCSIVNACVLLFSHVFPCSHPCSLVHSHVFWFSPVFSCFLSRSLVPSGVLEYPPVFSCAFPCSPVTVIYCQQCLLFYHINDIDELCAFIKLPLCLFVPSAPGHRVKSPQLRDKISAMLGGFSTSDLHTLDMV